MFLLPGRFVIPKNNKELEDIRNYTNEKGEIKEYSVFISRIAEKLITKSTNSGKITLGKLNGLFSIELYLGDDGEMFNIGENIFIKGKNIEQIIISNLKDSGQENGLNKEIDYISPKLDNHPIDLNGLRQLNEDIYLFSMNKRQAIFTSKFKEDISYIEIDGINYAIGESLISGYIWIYSLTENKWIATDKDKILKVKIGDKHGSKYLRIKRDNDEFENKNFII